MTSEGVLRLLEEVAAGRATPATALERLAWLPLEEVADSAAGNVEPYARLDHHRVVRTGYPEAVLCAGKTPEQVVEICGRLAERGHGFLATRADEPVRDALARSHPNAVVNRLARTVRLAPAEPVEPRGLGPVLVVSAGTSDLPVAEEAAETARALHNRVACLYDVGVAGIHRLLRESQALRGAAVVIAVAGMEGALASVVGGLVRVPVIAVPTSVGYGAAFGGLSALLAMLTSCAAGVTVVNIDNGFGAACAATRINQLQPAPS
ncbi:MAG: nickel pincer cofactor biosynthesis protein LarB [Gemmatimonadetes bacterium]|nr:nickel pincer cofactor biosynthesis protein LarB [Gemmatimonadota bacterium]